MHILIASLLVLLLLFGPQLWVQHVLKRHGRARDDFPGTGGDFARHLLKRLELRQVGVEASEQGDHYDPAARMVRLTPDKLNGKTLTAVTVAAHEVGHALQHKLGYRPLQWRSRLAVLAQAAQQVGNGLILLAPVVSALTRAPSSAGVMLLAGLASFGSAALVHLITLPVEWDASFRRALPLLDAGGYLAGRDRRDARQILTAAALTYVAASLASLLNLWRWLRWLRR
ncbi:MAG: zinc metallopeptidase [Gammaproteobacteria bacterium]|jgi:Zn-dependent membrane protease YugP